MALKDFPFKPGIYTDDTSRDVGAMGTWKSCDHVRFYQGLPEKIGGWAKDNAAVQLLGKVRSAIDWVSNLAVQYIMFGSSKKLYAWAGSLAFDVTPVVETGTLTNPFTTTINLPTVTVNDVTHGRTAGDSVIFSGASAVGGITIDGEYVVTSVTDADNYVITHTSNATSSAGPGGGAVGYSYLLPIGYDDTTTATGWGMGGWGLGTWGTPRTTGTPLPARMWSLDTWGEDIIACPRGGNLYLWDTSVGTSARATLLASAPTSNLAVFVSQEDRHVVALGADGDPMYIRWCSQNDYDDWVASATNTAGDKRLDQGTEILTSIKARGEHLIFTDAYVFSMIFVGPPDTFAFRPLGSNYGLQGQGAVAEFEGKVYWMGQKGFYLYDGAIRVVPCTVLTRVFDSLNTLQRAKIVAGVNLRFGEIWWQYPSLGSDEVDRYVVYNTQEKVWYFGTMTRTLYVGDSDIFSVPYAVGTDGYIYWHETGVDADGQALPSSLASGDVEIQLKNEGSGEHMLHLSKLIPDFTRLSGTVNLDVTLRRYPQDTETQTSGPHAITSSTKFVNPRARGRQGSFAFSTSEVGDDWRMGVVRADVLPHGKR